MKDKLPEAVALMELIQAAEPWNPVYRQQLEELFANKVFRSMVREILVVSDNMLKNIGQTDLTNEASIKIALRAQGVALGLAQAADLICDLATTPEPEPKETKNV